ncbi:MAG: patatin-like phospholipase family protein [Actinomycetia bacterium]|nr:patatin-like phospholipase family protein [Actinomycetes bacterium]
MNEIDLPGTDQDQEAASAHRSSRRCAFVLGGGGRWGAVEIGMLRALVEAGIQPDLICGTSIGAFNGAIFASAADTDGIAALERLWGGVAADDLLGARPLDRAKTLLKLRVAVQDPGPLRALLQDALPVSRIEDLAVPFQCVAASIERAAEHWFEEGPVVDAVLASAAVPALFPPVEIGGEHFYDGGLVNSVPVDRAIELGATEVFVLQVGRVEQPLRPPKRIHETALVSFEIARRHRFGRVRDRTIDGIDIHVLPSANDMAFDDPRQIRWSDMSETDELIGGAYEASVAYLAALDG